MSGRFEVYEDAAGRFRFRLKAVDGEVVASGHGYASQDSAIRGARSVRQAADGAPVVVTAETAGSPRVPTQQDGSPDESRSGIDTVEDPDGSVTRDAPSTRRFRFADGMSANSDLATRSGAILRNELGHDS